MEYSVRWLDGSVFSYYEEMEFIFLKWNNQEVNKFAVLVDENLKRLAVNPNLGIPIKTFFKIVISKQTTLYYKVIEKDKRIDLMLFWNTSKNPKDLAKLL